MAEREYDREWSIDDFSIFFDPDMPVSKQPFVELLALLAEKAPEPMTPAEEEQIRAMLRDYGYSKINEKAGDGALYKHWGHVTNYIWKYLGTSKGWPFMWEEGPYMTMANAVNFKAAAGRASEGFVARHRAVRPTAARRTAGGGIQRGAVVSEYDETPASCPDCYHTLPLNGVCGNCE